MEQDYRRTLLDENQGYQYEAHDLGIHRSRVFEVQTLDWLGFIRSSENEVPL